MDALELLEALKENNIEPLDNQAVANSMAESPELAALSGSLEAGGVSASLVEQLPESQTQTPEISETTASLSLTNTDGFTFS